jgi:predicted  nucleic acid-binding Zn-ribbon protein
MAVEKTVAEKLKMLFELQQIDSKIDQIAVLRGELPIEVSDLEDEIVGLDTRIDKAKGIIEDLARNVAQYEAAIKESEGLIARYQTQLDNVKNNREFEALTKELELQKLEIQLSERRKKNVLVEIENKKESLATSLAKRDVKQKELDLKKIELEDIIAKTNDEENALRKRSVKARNGIEERLIKSYDKIRSSYRNGLAVVTIQRDSCGGCFNKIPPQVKLEIFTCKNIMACEHCGRILVDEFTIEMNSKEAGTKA